ncbi:MAG: hypothetical protein ACMG6E_07790 [Candidatus Roizmanbacteria bacterium]
MKNMKSTNIVCTDLTTNDCYVLSFSEPPKNVAKILKMIISELGLLNINHLESVEAWQDVHGWKSIHRRGCEDSDIRPLLIQPSEIRELRVTRVKPYEVKLILTDRDKRQLGEIKIMAPFNRAMLKRHIKKTYYPELARCGKRLTKIHYFEDFLRWIVLTSRSIATGKIIDGTQITLTFEKLGREVVERAQ